MVTTGIKIGRETLLPVLVELQSDVRAIYAFFAVLPVLLVKLCKILGLAVALRSSSGSERSVHSSYCGTHIDTRI